MPAVASHIFHSGPLVGSTDTVVSTNSIIVYGILFSNSSGFNQNLVCRDNDGITLLDVRVPARRSVQLYSTWVTDSGLTFYIAGAGAQPELTGTVIYSESG